MMDKALKERIIGAIVLVVFVVLVVPVFLDGSAGEVENLQEKISLPGQASDTRQQKTVVLERDRDQPVPVASKQTEVRNETPPAAKEPKVAAPRPVTKKAESKTPPKPSGNSTVSKPQSTTGMWAVQLGSFANKANAERLASALRKQGYAAFLGQVQANGSKLHRVRVGPQKDRASAEAVAAKLRAIEHSGQVVPHP